MIQLDELLTVRNLWVTSDTGLTLDYHVKSLVPSCFYRLRNIAKLTTIVSCGEMEVLIHAFVSSCLDYCNALFPCFSKTSLHRLQSIQNTAEMF